MDLILCIAKHFAAASLTMPAPFLGGAALLAQSGLNEKQSRQMARLLCEILEGKTTKRRTR
jgi:hypothetical protein